MCVMVPVAPISRSPPTSETPTASPSRSAPDIWRSGAFGGLRLSAADCAADNRREPGGSERAGEQVGRCGLESAQDQRRRDRPQHGAELRARLPPACRTPERRPDRARTARDGRRPTSTQREAVARDRQLDAGLLRSARGACNLRRVRHLGDRRDARRSPPSGRTRWSTTPRRSGGHRCRPGCRSCRRRRRSSPADRLRAARGSDSRFGPWMLRSTPRIAALNSWRSVPSKTVRPMPAIPGLISSSGINCETAGRGMQQKTVRATAAAAVRIFIWDRIGNEDELRSSYKC